LQRPLPFLAGIMISVTVAGMAAADDRSLCDSSNTPADDAVAACSRRLTSGELKGRDIAITYNNRGWGWTKKGDLDRAIADYNEAIRLDPAYTNAYNNRASVWTRKGAHDRAIADYNEVIRLNPSSASAYSNRGRSWKAKGDLDRAIADYTEAIRLDASNGNFFTSRCHALNDKGEPHRALADCNEAIRLNPKDGFAYNNRGDSYNKRGQLDDALRDFEEAIRLGVQHAIVYDNRGLIYSRKRDYDRAIADFSEAIRLDPADPYPRRNRADAHRLKRDVDLAIADDNEAIRLLPGFAAAYTGRGLSFEQKGDRERARADFNAALALPAERYLSGRWAHDTARQRLAALASDSAQTAPVAAPAQVTPPPSGPQTAAVTPQTPPQAAQPADQGSRIALVIGNDAYENLPKLHKAVNDARTLEAALRALNFEVIRVENASRRTMNQRIFDFTARIRRGDTAFFFFAGHGVEVKGANYLLPTDTPPAREGQESLIVDESIAADSIVLRLQERGARVSLLVFDACRDNPFAKAGTRGVGGSRGLGLMAAPEGVFLLYSAGYGQAALDRLSDNDPHPNSVFTRTFAQLLRQQGKTIQDIAKATQSEVRRLALSINHQQMPAIYDQIDGTLMLAPR
jgi:tetratricopeptide (TPR) repeat protein